MITLEKSSIVIEDLEQILLLEEHRVRCLLKDSVIELSGNHFHVHSLTDKELIIKGKLKAVELNER